MEYDTEAVDEATLAIMYLGMTHGGSAVWKGYPWEIVERLEGKGFIERARTRNKSYTLTQEGAEECKRMFTKLFVKE